MTALQFFCPRVGKVLLLPVLTLFAALGQSAVAQGQTGSSLDASPQPWQETEVQLPDPPHQANLLPFYVSATATQDFAIDANSISIGSDGVVRYTLVTTSHAGARNISYEGIRCSTAERKQYAFGRPDGSWVASRRDRWEAIQNNAANRYHSALAKGYFCDDDTVAGPVDQILSRLRYQRPLSPLDSW